MRFILYIAFIFFFASCANNEPLNPKDAYFKNKFNDLQARQLATAKKLGIKPQKTRAGIDAQEKLIKIKSGKGYKIAHLTHSSAKVLPLTKTLIQDIGLRFLDSLEARDLFKERVVVTSLTRSKQDQKKLSSGNVNAAAASAHYHGTTFDISYIRFNNSLNAKRDVLANILEDLRKEKRCWVKYEINQKCFHITAR